MATERFDLRAHFARTTSASAGATAAAAALRKVINRLPLRAGQSRQNESLVKYVVKNLKNRIRAGDIRCFCVSCVSHLLITLNYSPDTLLWARLGNGETRNQHYYRPRETTETCILAKPPRPDELHGHLTAMLGSIALPQPQSAALRRTLTLRTLTLRRTLLSSTSLLLLLLHLRAILAPLVFPCTPPAEARDTRK